jgi:plasmid stabilization system protein ParE
MAARRITEKIYYTSMKLSEFPKSYPLCQEEKLRCANIRYFVIENFKVLYFLDCDTNLIYVLRIIYTKRNITNIDL